MKIIIVGGGASMFRLFWRPILEFFIEKGHDVVVLGPYDAGAVPVELASFGVRYIPVPVDRTGISPLKDIGYVFSLIRIFRKERPDRILSIAHKPIIYSGLAARIARGVRVHALLCGLGYVFTNSNKDGFRHLVAKFALLNLYRISRGYVCGFIFQNPDDEREVLRLGLLRSDLPRHRMRGAGVDISRFLCMPVELTGIRRFLLVARLLVDKGIREYVEAAKIVRRRYPLIQFHLVGPVDSNPSAIRMEEVTRWVDDGDIIFHGEQSDVRPFLRDCYAYILPSYREGTPQTSLEAMATGRAIITTDVPGCRETVFDVGAIDVYGNRVGLNGVLCTPRSSESLAAALMWALDNPLSIAIMGQKSRDLAEEHYESRKVAQGVVDFVLSDRGAVTA